MQKVLKTGSMGLLAFAVVAVLAAAPQQAEARPPFVGVFAKQYTNLIDTVKKVKCGVCHVGKDKKIRNEYGKALAKTIGKKNEKDKKKVMAAMVATEKMASAIQDKTFGELIKEGKLPGTTE